MTNILTFFTFIAILPYILVSITGIFAPHNPYQEKKTTFECGFHSFLGQNRTQFTISFFLFALLFLIFDLEILLVYPYALSSYINGIYGTIVMIIFFVILTFGLFFELGKKALSILSKQIYNIFNSIYPPKAFYYNTNGKSSLNLKKINNFFKYHLKNASLLYIIYGFLIFYSKACSSFILYPIFRFIFSPCFNMVKNELDGKNIILTWKWAIRQWCIAVIPLIIVLACCFYIKSIDFDNLKIIKDLLSLNFSNTLAIILSEISFLIFSEETVFKLSNWMTINLFKLMQKILYYIGIFKNYLLHNLSRYLFKPMNNFYKKIIEIYKWLINIIIINKDSDDDSDDDSNDDSDDDSNLTLENINKSNEEKHPEKDPNLILEGRNGYNKEIHPEKDFDLKLEGRNGYNKEIHNIDNDKIKK